MTHTITLTVPRVVRLTLSTARTVVAATPAQVLAGTSGSIPGPTIQVIANRLFSLQVRTTTASWTRPAGATKTAAALAFGFNGGAPVAMSTANRTLVTGGARGVRTYPSTFTIAFTPATDRPGAYSIVTRFTVTAP